MTEDTGRTFARRAVRVVSPAEAVELFDEREPGSVLVHYRGERRHPAGDSAQVSWFNDDGEGLIRCIDDAGLLVLPLRGNLRDDLAPVVAGIEDVPGPQRTSDLWTLVAALCSPDWFSITRALRLTYLSDVTVRASLNRLIDAGFIEARVPARKRVKLYRPCYDDPDVIAEFVAPHWQAWREGGGTAALKADQRYFVAEVPWRVLAKRLEGAAVWPTGVTYLEGGPQALDRPTVSAGGPQPIVDLYARVDRDGEFAGRLGSTLSMIQEPVMTGRLCLLRADHPVTAIHSFHAQYVSDRTPWPPGLAAMDAWNHADARVRQEARRVWRQWIESQLMAQEGGGLDGAADPGSGGPLPGRRQAHDEAGS